MGYAYRIHKKDAAYFVNSPLLTGLIFSQGRNTNIYFVKV